MARETTYRVGVEIGGNVKSSLEKSAREANAKLESISNAAKTAAKVAAAAFAAVNVGSFVSDAVSTHSEFEQTMASTAATAGASAAEYAKMEAAAREMGKKTTKTAAEASAALGYMALAGWDVDTSISALEPVLRLSEATQMDLATCSDLVTDSMSALGLSVDELSSYLDVAAQANNKSNQTAQQLMEAMIGCGGAARSAGMDYKETAAALGILANNGTKGSEAGTALNSMLVRMTTKDTAQTAFEKLGVSIYTSSGEMRNMQTILMDLNQALDGLTQEQKNNYMSAIAGTNYYTQFGYLLEGVREGADGAASSWSSLTAAFDESDGALMNMADTVTDTLSGAFARLDSAVDDAKISFADAFSGDLKGIVNDLSEYIPKLTQKFIDFAAKAGPKISRTFRSITRGAGEVWDVLAGAGGWAIDHFDEIEVGIAGVGGAIIAYKVVSGLKNMAAGVKTLGTAMKAMAVSNPWLLGLTLAASAIAGIAAAIAAAKEQAVQSNLEEHFGNIALSMDEISEVADYIVRSDSLTKVRESLAAFDELDGLEKSMQDSVGAINKLNWKTSIGMELTPEEQETYKSEIANYISDAQEYALQHRYAADLLFDGMVERNPELQGAVDGIKQFYASQEEELKRLGGELNQVVTEAFSDGLLDIDEAKEIAELQTQIANVEAGLATDDFSAELAVLEMDYSGKGLDPESFKELNTTTAEKLKEIDAVYKEQMVKTIGAADNAYRAGSITKEQYDLVKNDAQAEYLAQMSERQKQVQEFQMNTLMQTYGGELRPAFDQLWKDAQEVVDNYSVDSFGGNWAYQFEVMNEHLAEAIAESGLDDNSRGAIEELLDSMQPSIEYMEDLKAKCEAQGLEVPLSISEGLANVAALKALTGDAESIYFILGDKMKNSPFFKDVLQDMEAQGIAVPQALAKGTESEMDPTIGQTCGKLYAGFKTGMQAAFSKGIGVTAKVNIAAELNAAVSKGLNAAADIFAGLGGHAEGGIFDTPHVAWFAEDGPEAVIPLDKSSRALTLWEQAGQLLGVFGGSGKSRTGELYDEVSSSYVVNQSQQSDRSSSSVKIVLSPQITIQGSADREDVHSALRMTEEDLVRILEELQWQRDRTAFAT